jgi:methyl-accepting chemotaxis protein
MNLDTALQSHIDWKQNFRNAIAKQQQMDVTIIAMDNCCELGIWLHGEAKVKYSILSNYSLALTKHAEFHVEAGKIASAINANSYAEAEAMLTGDSTFTKVSIEVGVAIMHLKLEVPQ